ncbi:hypothetical protein [Secundilactobacillus kimchicus]|uniref:hypothetical protein n=1 Tax=Secundilactobacillus kimchicus TaxID=528209 RepID=UPI0024A982C3|nr:hypothetical protein [Secundilactobacillus kimchicus]
MANDSDLTVTAETVKSDFKAFQEFTDDHVTEAIKRAKRQVLADRIESDDVVKQEAVTLYARHVLFSDGVMSYGGTLSGSTFGNSQTVRDFGGYDYFLSDYEDIKAKYGCDENMGAVWTE